MYEAFFSLEDAPFVLTPDPRFLLRSKGHHEVLSALIYGITSQKGVMALIGDVGTGKTLLCRALLRELPKNVRSALVLNPYLSDVELLGTILDDLGVERRGATKGELMGALSQYLLTAGAEGQTVVVVLDEAQQLSADALEQIRILSTIETATRKLLQVVLSGQPELEETLRLRELRQLDQRIGIRCYLEPLSKKETVRYIEHRLRIAGLPGALPFARGALQGIYDYSGGIPRVINLVCDRSLAAAFSARAREVSPALVKAAIHNLEGERRERRRSATVRGERSRSRSMVPAAAMVAALLLVGGTAVTTYRSGWAPGSFHLRSGSTASARAPGPPPAELDRVARETPPAPGATVPPRGEAAPGDGMRDLVAQVLRLWGVDEDLSEQAMRAWPLTPEGAVDVAGVALQYQLAATLLPETTLAELRAVDWPAILELNDRASPHPHLLRRLGDTAATLVAPGGQEARVPVEQLDASWTHSAWVIWRNVDLLPPDPSSDLTATVVTTLALRLQGLGFLSPPVPSSNNERFQEAVRRFQASRGIAPDGIVGPRTTLALTRVVTGRFGPSLVTASGGR